MFELCGRGIYDLVSFVSDMIIRSKYSNRNSTNAGRRAFEGQLSREMAVGRTSHGRVCSVVVAWLSWPLSRHQIRPAHANTCIARHSI
jgi:hypothetical protein